MGWSIEDNGRQKTSTSNPWTNFPSALFQIRVNGEALPEGILVSNIRQTALTGSSNVGNGGLRAQGFRTGGGAGFKLNKIEVNFASVSSSPSDISALVVDLYSASGNNPGTRLHTLTNPGTFAADNNTFTAPAGVALRANTRYFVVFSCPTGGIACVHLSRTAATAEDGGAAQGWSIDNRRHYQANNSSWQNFTEPHLIRVFGEENAPPVFSGSQTAYRVAENSTAVATLAATDADSEDTARSYALSGADSGKFSISTSGILTFSAAPNHEDPQDVLSITPSNAASNNQYIVTVTVTSGTGDRALTAERTLTVTVTDVSEPPGKPATPTLSSTTETSITITWTPPTNTGPAISKYTVQRVNGTTSRQSDVTAAARSYTFTDLSPGVTYDVSVRAFNAEGWSAWSDEVSITTTPLPSVSIARKSTTEASVAEGTTPVFVVTASRAPSSNLTVKLTVAEETGRDFVASTGEGSKTVTISTTSTSAEYSVSTVNDNVDEPNGDVTVSVASGTGYTVGSPASASVTITDNEAAPTVTLILTPSSIDESGTSNRSTVTASLNRASSQATTVTVSTAAVSPAVSGDFTVTSNKRLTIAAGSTTSTGTVRITAVNNNVDAANKSVTVSATAVNTQGVTAPTAKTLTITDDDTSGVILSRTTTLGVPEAGSATYSVKLATQPTANVIITPDSDDDTSATVSTSRSDNTLVFTTSNWNSNQTVTVSGVNDDKDNVGNKREVDIEHTATSTDSIYNGITITDLDVDVNDDDANNRPKFADGTASAYEFAENTAAATAVTTFSASDIDDQDSITGYSISGTDASKFSITDAGVLTFKASPDYESPTDNGGNNVYNLTVRVNSGDSSATPSRATSRILAITVTVTDVDEPPVFPTGATAQSVTEDVVFSYTAPAAADPEGATVTYAATKTDNTALPSWLSFNAMTRAFSGTPLEADTPDTINVRVTATDATSNSGHTDFVLTTLEDNDLPVFSSSSTFSLAENTTSVGTVVADDPDHGDSVTEYSVNQDRQGRLFEINSTSGALSFKAAPNFEAPAGGSESNSNTYSIQIQAKSDATGGGREKVGSQNITVTVTDDDTEAPSAPSPSATTTFQSISLTWAEPSNAGPPITGYDVRYKLSTVTNYPSSPQLTVTTLSATIGSLNHDSIYNVQVRARNDEGSSAYSTAISPRTKRNVAPVISTTTTDYDVDENSTATIVTLAASDADTDDSISAWTLSGTDEALFSITNAGALTFKAAPNYEDPKDSGANNVYDIIATVTGGTGTRAMTDSITLEITVDDVLEAPGKPAAPTVSTSTVTSITIVWSPPSNTGPPITGYNVGWRPSGQGNYRDLRHTGTTTRAVIPRPGQPGLNQNTTYQFRVQAKNDEGTGVYSEVSSAQAKEYDKYGYVVTPTAIAICEDPGDADCTGKPNTFTISLQKAPTSNVTIKPRIYNRRGAVSPESLTFTPSNWYLPQTVTVTAKQDPADAPVAWPDGTKTKIGYIRSTTDSNYKKLYPKRVTVTIYDDDTAAVEVDLDPDTAGIQLERSVDKGNPHPLYYTIRLNTKPTYSVHINVYADGGAPYDDGGLWIRPPSTLPGYDGNLITFNDRNWNIPKRVKVYTSDVTKGTIKIKHYLPNYGGYNPAAYYGNVPVPEMTLTINLDVTGNSRIVVGDEGPNKSPNGLLPPNTLPIFDPDVDTTLEVAENSPAGTNVGEPVMATDLDEGDTLTYSLSGDDATSFAIDDFGQITTIAGVTYDYERRSYLPEPAYSLVVNVSDGNGVGAAIPVTVTLTDVDDDPGENLPPEFHEGESTTRKVAENSPAGTNVGKPVTAFDPNGDKLSYIAFDGADGAFFNLDAATGQITTKAGVTYSKSSYNPMVIVVESETDAPLMTGIQVVITFTEAVEEEKDGNTPDQPDSNTDASTDTTSDTTNAPTTTPDTAPTVTDTSKFKTHYATVGQSFSLVLPAADADSGNGGPYSYALLNRTGGTAFGANGLSFDATTRTLSGTPTAEDTHELAYQVHDSDSNTAKSDAFVEKTKLKIVVLPGGQAVGNSGPQQSNDESANQAPTFDANLETTLSMDEHSPAGTNVGSPITATDPNKGDTLTYSLSGTDSTSFEIGSSTGQITTKTGVNYDYESKSSYSLTVVASDGKLSNSTPVTVNLTNVAETPVTACETDLGTLSASALYAGKWDDAKCKAHHQDSRARYFKFTVSEQTPVTITLSAGAMYVSKGKPNNGWGSVPGPGHEHRKQVRRDNGKLVHDGPHSATEKNDGNTVTLTLQANTTYTVEAAGESGDFTVSIAPQ